MNNNGNNGGLFPSMKAEKKEIIPTKGLKYVDFKEMQDGEVFHGTPELTSVQPFDYYDNKARETKTGYRSKLYLLNHQDKEFTVINLNVKKKGMLQEDIWEGSLLFNLIKSLEELKRPGCMEGLNKIDINLLEVQAYVNKLSDMTIKIKTINNGFSYNNFTVTNVQEKEMSAYEDMGSE